MGIIKRKLANFPIDGYISKGPVKRVFWATLTLVTFAILVVHTFFLVRRFSQFDTNIELEIVTEKRIDFPGELIILQTATQVLYSGCSQASS